MKTHKANNTFATVSLSKTDLSHLIKHISDIVTENICRTIRLNSEKLMTEEETGKWLGRSRSWVSKHKEELGVIYLGNHPYFSRLSIIEIAKRTNQSS